MKTKSITAKLLLTAVTFLFLLTCVTVVVNAEPYGEYTIVPDNKTVIVATDFDSGVYGKAAADGNKDIRPDETVNTEIGGSEFGGNIGWIAAGDWVQYTVNVAQDGKYRASVWIASDSDSPGGVKLYYNDTEVGTSENSARDGWQIYDLYFVADFEMTAGEAVLKTEYTGGLNISAIEIIPLGENGYPIWIAPELEIKSYGNNIIKATDFDPGVYGKAAADGNKDIRPDEDVNTEIGESEFGSNIGWIAGGDWVQYSVNVQRDGVYKFAVWIASDADEPGGVRIYCDDVEVGTSENAAKSGWQAYELYDVGEGEITAGDHIIKAEFTGGVNFSAFEVSRTGDIVADEPETEADETTEETDITDETISPDSSSTEKEPGGNTAMIIIIIAAAVIIVVVVIIIVVRKKRK